LRDAPIAHTAIRKLDSLLGLRGQPKGDNLFIFLKASDPSGSDEGPRSLNAGRGRSGLAFSVKAAAACHRDCGPLRSQLTSRPNWEPSTGATRSAIFEIEKQIGVSLSASNLNTERAATISSAGPAMRSTPSSARRRFPLPLSVVQPAALNRTKLLQNQAMNSLISNLYGRSFPAQRNEFITQRKEPAMAGAGP
jgi:hypothetical protein